MENGNLNTDELEVLRTAARDSFYIHAQVENANRKLETALRVWEKVKEGEKEAIRARKKAFIYYCVGVVWFSLSLILSFLVV
ncbi:hypothetical protein [Neisseria sp. HMSC064E01]|uniref:hypothetical protein n=1 Tax=Neisseria sp. HMSC064E01 TaxID=1715052 RepID=UPI0008A3858C|nr:hypothetical protein [Neisseria sp. HMSC064E01]OFN82856.1 hypothetical protein HMPREF2572_03930 [Neisseria sp. HMSC064E01]DAK54223.1 MAG TPA: hypothetical protein [Caudoviricetes sp.]